MQVTEATMAKVAGDVLATMAFAIVMPEESETSGAAEYRGVVDFRGPVSGAFRLALPESIVPALANNMLGRDESEACTDDEKRDAVGELANVICGNLLAEMAGPKPVFRLDAPKVEGPAPQAGAALEGSGTTRTRVWLANGYADIAIALEG
jgi:CheY-specific phosphatase CheX